MCIIFITNLPGISILFRLACIGFMVENPDSVLLIAGNLKVFGAFFALDIYYYYYYYY